MAKIMLVEDDNSLREIYEARLTAEGYTVVSAKDGEEALALALKERPELIIADVMMPKVSGFDMLDILRSTPETKNTKIIIMTALSQAEDKARAEKLGADRYLVKSQVTLEDVTREARAILDELDQQAAATVATAAGTPAPAAPTQPAPTPDPTPAPSIPAAPAEPPQTKPSVTSIPVAAAPDDEEDTAKLEETAEALSQPEKKEQKAVDEQEDAFIASNPTLSTSPDAAKVATQAVDSLTKPDSTSTEPDKEKKTDNRAYVSNAADEDKPSSSLQHTKKIEPTPESERKDAKPDLNALLEQEGDSDLSAPPVNSVITPNDTGGTPPAV